MSTPVKPKKSRKEPQPSYRSIQLAILAELKKQTTLLEVLAKQGDRAAWHKRYDPPYTGGGTGPITDAAASGLPG